MSVDNSGGHLMQWMQVTPEQMEHRIARWDKREVIPIQKVLPAELNRELIADQVFGVVTSNTANDPQNFFDTAPIQSGISGMAVSIVSCPAQQGPGNHVHQFTYENFMPLAGRWRIYWGDQSEHHVDLEQWDMVSVPPGTMRRFKNISEQRAQMLVLAYGEGKLDNDIYIPPEEFTRLREQFGDQHAEMIDRIEQGQAMPIWTEQV